MVLLRPPQRGALDRPAVSPIGAREECSTSRTLQADRAPGTSVTAWGWNRARAVPLAGSGSSSSRNQLETRPQGARCHGKSRTNSAMDVCRVQSWKPGKSTLGRSRLTKEGHADSSWPSFLSHPVAEPAGPLGRLPPNPGAWGCTDGRMTDVPRYLSGYAQLSRVYFEAWPV